MVKSKERMSEGVKILKACWTRLGSNGGHRCRNNDGIRNKKV